MTKEDTYFELAKEIVKDVSFFLLDRHGTTKEMKHKEKKHYCIAEDRESNGMYEDFFVQHTPEVGLYTEEGKRELHKEYTWVVDPIDGTTNYRVGNPLFVTQLSLLRKRQPVFSIISAPVLKLQYVTRAKKGSFLNDNPIHGSSLDILEQAVIGFNKGTDPRDSDWLISVLKRTLPHVRTLRLFGSAGLQLAFVAGGMLDLFISNGADLYDYLPGVLLVREAGGEAVSFKGSTWQIEDSTLIAGKKALVDKILPLVE
ncbi:MAG TPA: inositol monophosphatase [Patescibacteria group bacterium]|nr:inositol monophosphatase [Patescibacteria group bacterium]